MYSFRVQITIDIPDDLAAKVIPPGRDSGHFATELFGLQAYRDGRISERSLQRLLDLESIFDVQEFLKARLGDEGQDTIESVENDLANLTRPTPVRNESAAQTS